MKCEQAEELLTPYIDRELHGWWRRHFLRKHLEQCPDCSRSLEIYRRIKYLLRNLTSVQAPEELRNRIKEKLHEVEHTRTV